MQEHFTIQAQSAIDGAAAAARKLKHPYIGTEHLLLGLLKEVTLFDVYTGTGIAPGKKSVAFNLTLRSDERSLTAEEADADVKNILALLEKEYGAVLR